MHCAKPVSRASKASPHHSSQSSVRKKPLPFLSYLIAISVLIFLSTAEDKSPRPENSSDEGLLRFLSRDYWYEVALGRPRDHAQHVAVITIGSDVPSGLQREATAIDTELSPGCKRRLYEAAVLRALSAFHPRVIVVDMWLDPKGCTVNGATDVLLNEIGRVNVPLVFGLGTFDPAALIKEFPAEFVQARNRQPPLKPTELVLMPIVHPIRSVTNSLSEGTVELNSDNRKIPLSWPVYDNFQSVGKLGQPKRLDSLAVAAVRAFDHNNKTLKRIGALRPDGSPEPSAELHPYTSFLPIEALPTYRALDVVCSNPIGTFWKDNCPSLGTNSIGPLDEKIVLVGLAGVGGDVHQSAIGNVPGVVLQANYVESLLDGRVFKPVPVIYEIIVGILWLAVIFWIPLQFLSYPGLALVFSLAVGLITALLALGAISQFRFYPERLIPLILIAFLLNITRQIERWISHREEVQ
jgi:CHASE2 domain